MKQKYKIYNKKNKLWWSNEWGWGNKRGATTFKEIELTFLNLPIGGMWKEVS